MRVIGFRIERWLRSTWRGSIGVAVALVVSWALVLVLAAGAQRTATSPDRYAESFEDAPDLQLTQEVGGSMVESIARLPSVASASGATFVFGGIVPPGGGEPYDAIVFAGDPAAFVARVVEGRTLDPGAADEVVATRRFAEANGLRVGDRLELVTLTPETVATSGFTGDDPDGPTFGVELVGLLDSAIEIEDPSAVAVVPPAILEGGDVGGSATVMGVTLAPRATAASFRQQLDTLPGGDLISVEPVEIASDDVRDAVRTQAIGLWILAAVVGLAVVASVGPLLVRYVRLADGEPGSLSAIGVAGSHLRLEPVARAALVCALAMPIAAALSIIPSSVFPFGFVDQIEPDPGRRFDLLTVAATSALLIVGFTSWVLQATRPWRPRRRSSIPFVEVAASSCPEPAMATGVRFALSGGDRRTGRVATGVAATAAIVALLAGAVTFGTSLLRLVEEPFRYGANFDALLDDGAETVPDELLELLRTHHDISDATVYRAAQVRVGDRAVPVAGYEPVRGSLLPVLLEGRLPTSPDEIAVGRVSGRDLDLGVGDVARLALDDAESTYVVTGIVIPPPLRGNDVVGRGLVLSTGGFERLASIEPNVAALRLFGDGRSDGRARLAEAIGVSPDDELGAGRPPAVRNLARITFVPFTLAAVLGLLATLGVVAAVVGGLRRRRRDLAILQALGADRRWRRRAARWQAAAWVAVPLAIGIPLGVVGGRMVFRAVADGMGAVNDSAVPLGLIAGVGLVLVVAGLIAAVATAGTAATPGRVLRTE